MEDIPATRHVALTVLTCMFAKSSLISKLLTLKLLQTLSNTLYTLHENPKRHKMTRNRLAYLPVWMMRLKINSPAHSLPRYWSCFDFSSPLLFSAPFELLYCGHPSHSREKGRHFLLCWLWSFQGKKAVKNTEHFSFCSVTNLYGGGELNPYVTIRPGSRLCASISAFRNKSATVLSEKNG